MFKIVKHQTKWEKAYYIKNNLGNYMHSDGNVYRTREYWPTRELAQAVLDKYQPPHVWEHGDVFRTTQGWIMMYHRFFSNPPQVMCIVGLCDGPSEMMERNLQDATFLFNIREKL